MTLIPRSHKIFYGVICAAALLIGVLGYFFPPRLAAIATWLVLPPLHARFVGALYFYGAIFMVSCMTSRYQAEVRLAMRMIATWTGLLFVVSILSLSAFDLSLLPPWIWFASYSIYPLIALYMAWTSRREGQEKLSGAPLPAWARTFLSVQGVIVAGFALALMILPNAMVALWPWKITPLLAQTYGGPLLALSVGSWSFAQRHTWAGARPVIPAMFVFAAGVLIASCLHLSLFSFAGPAAWVWFFAFATATLFLGAMMVHVLSKVTPQPGENSPKNLIS